MPENVSSTEPLQLSSSALQSSAIGVGPLQMKPDVPLHVRTPAQVPKPFVFVHASPPPTSLSMTKLQSLSSPSQTSEDGGGASHTDQPVPPHVCVPVHVPLP